MGHTREALRSALAMLLVALICQQTCLAQVDAWERVKLIEQGKNVHIKLHSGKTVKGKMEAWSGDGLSVRQGKDKVVPVAKSDVAQVALLIGRSRGRKAGLAALITAGVWAGLIGLGCAAGGCSGQGSEGLALMVLGTPVMAGWAAGIAALFPQHKEVIYRALPRTSGKGASRRRRPTEHSVAESVGSVPPESVAGCGDSFMTKSG